MIQESGAGLLTDHTPHALAAGVAALCRDAQRRVAMGRRALEYANLVLSPAIFHSRVKSITGELLNHAGKAR